MTSKPISSVLTSLAALALAAGCSHEQAAPKTAPAPTAQIAPAPPPVKAEAPVQTATLKSQDDAVYFDFDSAMLRDDSRPLLQELAEKVKANPRAKIRIEGNCDERGTQEYNLGLGAHRADAAMTGSLSQVVSPRDRWPDLDK